MTTAEEDRESTAGHNLWRLFSDVAAAVPDREAIVWRKTRRTYKETHERACRLANVLHDAGLGIHTERSELKGWESGQDFVGMYLLNGPEFLETNLAGYAARVAPFNVNYRYVAEELTYLLDDSGANGLVYSARFAPTLAEVLPRLKHRPKLLLQVADDSGEELLAGAMDYERALAAASPELKVTDQDLDDLYVVYTGGTTGMPKGTLWRQADIFVAAIGSLRANMTTHQIIEDAKADGAKILPNAPFMHAAAQWVALNTLTSGGTMVINEVVDRLDPQEVWTTIEREKIAVMLMVGEPFARPLITEFEKGRYDASPLLLILSGGAVLSPETKKRMTDQLPNVAIVDTAGGSETGANLQAMSTKDNTTDAAAFIPSPRVQILDETKSRVLAKDDHSVGWFATSGAIPLGYNKDEKKSAATFVEVDGTRWSVLGDRARWRSDGMLELLGRDSVTINSGGEKIFAEEVEQAVIAHPGVNDAIVVGRPSEKWGNEVVAVIQTDKGVTDEEILATAAQRISRYKLPKAIVRVDKVVRSPAGKADYRWAKKTATGAGA